MLFNVFKYKRLVTMMFLQKIIGVLMIFGLILGAAWALSEGRYRVTVSFAILGAAIGVILFFSVRERTLMVYLRSGILTVFIAWCTSLSLGYNTPTLVTGPLILFLMVTVRFACQLKGEYKVENKFKGSLVRWVTLHVHMVKIANGLVILAVISSVLAFGIARQKYIYREQSATHLVYDLGDVLPGAKGIKTNKNTYDFLKDLQTAKNIVREMGRRYCIIPDSAANWVKDAQSNPISTDWPNNYAVGRIELLERVIGELEENRGSIIVIIQKYKAATLSEGFFPLSEEYVIANYVRSNFDKIGETQYFELYE